jgi:branched-chain amino acid aminotransferase
VTNRSGAVWIDGRLVPAEAAWVSAFDHALLTGDGVFETLRVYGGRAFAVRRHLERLARSATGLGLEPPAPEVVRAALDEVIAANRLDGGRLRVTLTGGPAPLGSARGPDGPTLLVAGGPLEPWPATVDVVVVPWPRNERGALAGLKTVSYAENVVALAHANERGASEAIFANVAGSLCEGTGSNVFAVVDGRLVTPTLASGCLAGVTRDLLLEQGHGEEVDVPVAALATAEEAFLTSTTREAQPIRAVDGTPLATAPGERTRAALDAFRALVARDIDP